MTTDHFAGAALIPGFPHLLAADPAPSWRELATAAESVGQQLRANGAEVMVLLSTQWFTVLGHQVQMDPRLADRRVDENWYAYDYGTLDYDFNVDIELSEQWANKIETAGLQARKTRYDNFPIDTGVIVARQLLDPENTIPVAQVSCNLYAGTDDIATLGRTAMQAAESTGRRVAVVSVSGLSSGLIQRWIDPADDKFESPENEKWDRRILDLLERGFTEEALRIREEYAEAAGADSQFRALSFLAGTGQLDSPARICAFGPIWGTGGAVIHWPTHRS